MSFLNSFSGTISEKSKYISTDDIRNALSDSYKVSVIDQSNDSIRCKLIIPKYWLGLASYEIGLHPRISIKIDRGHNYSNLAYEFFWPDYLIALFFSIVIGVAAFSTTNDMLVVLTVFLLVLMTLIIIFHVQNKAHSYSISTILEKL